MNWIDTHCHLYVEEFAHDQDAMIERAISTGISRMMMPNIDESSIPSMLKLADAFPGNCLPMMGLHPCSVKADYHEVLDRMELEFEKRSFAGVGETGIDLYWDKTFEKEQVVSFERQISWARHLKLPVIIHSRESLPLTIEIITRHQDGELKGIFHCFSGTKDQVEQINKLGFKVGIGGVLTYKKAGLMELLPDIPRHMLVLETDSPYLAPVPHRGKRNEPLYLADIASRMADILGLDLAEVAEITTRNAEEVYGKKD
jgi:TatD DNase family protein